MASLAASVAETLLSQFLAYAQLSVDRGEAPQDGSYEKALQGLQVAAAQAGPIVVDRVLAWREGSLRGAKAERSELYSKKKMLVTDAVVLEALVFLAQADLSLLPTDKLPKLEFLALDWMLEQASYVDARFTDLAALKDRVLSVVCELLGVISVLRLGPITDRFLQEMGRRIRADYSSPARSQLDWMLQGMRLLQLRGDTDEQLRASKAFLEKAHPLRHEAKDKKSRLQQAICDMLTSVLQQLLEREDPSLFGAECDPALRKLWFAQVHTLRVDLLKWVNKQSKQVLSGLPTIAMLSCIEEEQSLVSAVEGVIELLHKQLKDRRNASMAVQCLTWCVGTFLRRTGQRIPRDKLSAWAAWAVAPVIQGMTRGGLAAPEQQELVRGLCAVVAPYLPELALTKMVVELMAPPGQEGGSTNWDAPMAGATALLSILAAAPARLAAAAAAGVDVLQPPSQQLGWEPPLAAAAQGGRLEKGVWLPSGESMQDLLNLVLAGYSPLQAYGVAQLGPRVSQALSSLLKDCHRIYGAVRLISPASRAASEALARERTLSVLPVFVMALQCLPFIMPDHWAEGKVFEDLLLYTVHIEQPMRQVSYRVLHRIVVCMPHLRDQLVGSMATFIARIQEDYLEVIRERLGELMSLMQEWGDIVAAERAAGLGPADTPTSPTVGCLHRVEGAGLALLCSNDVEVRRLGVELLRSMRELHRSLVACQPGSSRRSTAEPLQFRPGTAGSGGGAAAAPQRRVSQQSSGGDGGSVPSTPGAAGGLGEHYSSRTVYVADVLDRSGTAAAQRCYWDFSRWSDIWRSWRPLPPTGATFELCMMRTFTNDDNVRWARLLCEVMKEVWRRCEASAGVAHNEMALKLQHLLTPDSNGRYVLPTDSTADPRLDVARNYCLALAAAPLMEASHSERLTAASTREMARMLVSNARSGTEAQQQVSVLALGNAHHSCHGVVVSEAAEMVNDYGDRSAQRSLSMGVPMVGASRSSKARKDDLRLTHANILRVLADNLPPGALVKSNVVRDRLTEWVRDTYRHITSVTELTVEQQQLRHCLACVARHCSLQLAEAQPQSFTQQLRKQLFDMFSLWCEEGRPGGAFRTEQRRSIQALKLRMKDVDAGRQLETELADGSDVLEHAAYLGMAAMLNGPLFTADVRNPEGQVFSWADRMLYTGRNSTEAPASRAACWGPPKAAVARSGLRYLLQSNPSLTSIFVDRSYARNQIIAAGYFQVLAEVYASQELPVSEEVLVSLMLHRVVDPRQEVRDAARGLLSVLSRRQWGRETRYSEHDAPLEVQVPESGSLVVGILHDSQQSHQLRLSARLARDHPLLAGQVALEVLARQLDNDTGPEALLCLCPWLAHISLGLDWEGQQAERLLQLLYRITASQGQRHSYQVQKLWATLGGNKRNVVPILDFLIDRGLKECATDQSETPCAVGKAVALYLSRVAPTSTIDHLVQEVQQQLSEVDGVRSAETPQAANPKILEFHHSPLEAAAWRSSAALSASGGSRPTTPVGTPGIKAGGAGGLSVLLKTQSAWSESSFTSSAERGPHGGGEGASKGDGHSPALSRRNSDIKMPSLERRGALTRPELALCLLTELAYEHDEEFRRHLPTLLQVVTLNADSPNVTVRQECAQLLTYLLYSLACKHLEAQVAAGSSSPEYQRVAKLIGRLRTLRGQPLWAREQPTLANPYVDSAADVTSFVQTVVDCFYFDTALRERWCAEALMWACAAHSRHFASRSHQVFCALSPALSSTSCTAMLSALLKCLQSTTAQSLDTAVEVLCTLRTLLDNLAGSKVLLYPQLLLAAVALLNSTVVRVGELAMQIVLQVLSQLDLGDPTVQHTVLALLPVREGEEAGASNENSPLHNRLPSPPTPQDSAASADAMAAAAAQLWPLGQGLLGGVHDVPEDLGPWMALPQLVVKALFQPDTQLLALEVLAAIARQIGQAPLGSGQCMGATANGFPQALGGLFSSLSLADSLVGSDGMFGDAVCGVESVLGDAEVGIAVSLGAALPWLWVHLTDSATADTAATFLEGMSCACASVGWRDLSAVLAALAGMAGLDGEPPGFLMPLCQAICAAMFPAYTRLVAQRLVEVVQRGTEPYQAAAVAVLKVIFEVPGADLGEVSWFARDSKIITTLSAHVDTLLGPQILDLFQAMMRLQGSSSADRQQQSARETLEWPRCMDDLGDSNKLCTEALARVLEACPDGGLQPALATGSSGVDLHLLPFLHG